MAVENDRSEGFGEQNADFVQVILPYTSVDDRDAFDNANLRNHYRK